MGFTHHAEAGGRGPLVPVGLAPASDTSHAGSSTLGPRTSLAALTGSRASPRPLGPRHPASKRPVSSALGLGPGRSLGPATCREARLGAGGTLLHCGPRPSPWGPSPWGPAGHIWDHQNALGEPTFVVQPTHSHPACHPACRPSCPPAMHPSIRPAIRPCKHPSVRPSVCASVRLSLPLPPCMHPSFLPSCPCDFHSSPYVSLLGFLIPTGAPIPDCVFPCP